MVFWSGERLKERLELESLITDYDEHAIDCAAYTLRIGDEIYISPDNKMKEPTRHTKQRLHPGEGFAIPPGQFAFLTTKEKITVPDNAIAFISIRARPKFRGLINISGFHVDPGYNGRLVFSVLNAGPTPHHLQEDDELFLIWYADLDRSTEMKKQQGDGHFGLDPRLVNDISGEILSLQNLSDQLRDLRDKVEWLYKWRQILISLAVGLAVGFVLLVISPWISPIIEEFYTRNATQSHSQPVSSVTPAPSSAPVRSGTQSP